MLVFEWIVVLLLVAVLLAGAARRVGAPYPAFLALGGAALAFVPGAPRFVLDPGLALALFVAPVLLDAAYDTSLRDLKDNWAPVASLVLVAVGLTTAAVAIVAHALVPGLPWAAAVALGAVVAPPDAAAATAVLRQVHLPRRLLTIVEGESLLNDASALLIYRLAVGAVAAGAFSPGKVAPTFLLGVAGSIIAGPLLARLYMRLVRRLSDDAPSQIILQFVGTFGVWILAERIGLSGVLTIVCYAIAIAQEAPDRTPARLRVPSYAVWETAVFVLNVLAFFLIGLQIRPIMEALDPAQQARYLVVAGAVLATVIAVRIAWVMAHNTVARLKIRLYGFHPPRPMSPPTVRGGLIVSWSGMRGIVTLAAALALPLGGAGAAGFPFRDLIVLTAFIVVLGTLVIQGLTLRPVLGWLDLRDDDPVGREVARARDAAFRAALEALDGDTSTEAKWLRKEYTAMLRQAGDAADPRAPIALPADDLRRRAIAAARAAVSDLRRRGEIGDDAFHRLEEQLDWSELSAGPRSES
ncbi:MAG TPA: Na+/H+ antiporter [Stellaceae bacterium]|nr:Na+/H+ antiporter [Stellaceae bacterium]